MITNYASRTLIEEKHELDNFIITNISHTTNPKELIIIELFYFLSNTLYNNKTPGDTIINIVDTIPKPTKALLYIIKSSIKYLSLKSPYINLISSLIDLIHYIIFIGNTNGVSLNYIDYIFNRRYYCNNNNITINNNTFLLKQMILNEVISFIGVLFPQQQSTQRYRAIDRIHISRLCALCKDEPSNIVSFKCGHRYCYYCYIVERENKQIQDDDNNNMYCFICENN